MRIVVVEDEADLREEVVFNLAGEGFDVVGVGDGVGLQRELLQHTDLVLLDVGLPGEDGFSIARRLRSDPASLSIGIIMLTAMGTLNERVQGLEDGADAYLVKPVDFLELRACIESLSRRLSFDASRTAEGCWTYGSARWELVAPSGAKIKLTLTEKKLIDILVREPGKAVTRRDIIAQGLGESLAYYDERRLEALVSRLRRKIEQSYPLSQPIQSAHGVGYAFAERVVQDAIQEPVGLAR